MYIFHKMFLNKDKRLANQMYIGIIFEQPKVFFCVIQYIKQGLQTKNFNFLLCIIKVHSLKFKVRKTVKDHALNM